MFENIRLLYRFYGGGRGLLSSAYFWIALALSLALGTILGFGPWHEIAHNTLPSLTGFSIAAFAIIFVVLKPEQISALLKSRSEKDKPPLLSIASVICHAILIQVATILFAGIVTSIDQSAVIELCCGTEPTDSCWKLLGAGKWMLDFLGYFLLFYSWLLVSRSSNSYNWEGLAIRGNGDAALSVEIKLTEADRRVGTPGAGAQGDRAHIVLLAAEGLTNQIARSASTVTPPGSGATGLRSSVCRRRDPLRSSTVSMTTLPR